MVGNFNLNYKAIDIQSGTQLNFILMILLLLILEFSNTYS